MNEKAKLPLKDELFLSPVEKYKIYGQFPWRMIVSVCLAIATTAQILIVIGSSSSFTRAEERFFHEQFVDQPEQTEIEYPKKKYLYSLNELKDHVISSVENYYNLAKISLENITYPTNINNVTIPMNIYYINSYYNKSKKENLQKYYQLDKYNSGPFEEGSENTLKLMISKMKYFILNYTFYTYAPFNFADYKGCFFWEIQQVYSFEQRSHFSVSLNIKRISCEDEASSSSKYIKSYSWIHLIVLLLSLFNLIMTSSQVLKNTKIYWHLKSKYKEIYMTVPKASTPNETKTKSKWDLLTNKDKQKFFQKWNIISLVASFLQFFGAMFALGNYDSVDTLVDLLIGVGCFMAYICMARYLDYIREYSTIFNTIKTSIPNVLRYFVGVMPIFLGFIFFGVAIFWRSERFASIPMSMITLFAMMNGDSIYDIIKDLAGVNFFIGQVYSYIFGILFIAVVMNIFVSIIEEAYVTSKMTNQNHWIYSFLKLGGEDDKEKGSGKGLDEMTKDKRKICEIVRSKNILRDAINMEMTEIDRSPVEVDPHTDDELNLSAQEANPQLENKPERGIRKSKSMKYEDELKKYNNKIDKALTEAENIAKGIVSSSESKIKNELKSFLQDQISTLEFRIREVQNKLN